MNLSPNCFLLSLLLQRWIIMNEACCWNRYLTLETPKCRMPLMMSLCHSGLLAKLSLCLRFSSAFELLILEIRTNKGLGSRWGSGSQLCVHARVLCPQGPHLALTPPGLCVCLLPSMLLDILLFILGPDGQSYL